MKQERKNMRIRIDEKDTTMSGWLKAQKSKTASIRTLIRMASYVPKMGIKKVIYIFYVS